jgi:ubiquinone/menaquinone biosynthesis C-methylase UbiE
MNAHLAVAVILTGLVVVPAGGQTTPKLLGPTDDQLTLSQIEVRRLVTLMRLEPGMTIADVGAGLGAWTLRFAQWTGPSGRVFATDIGEEQLTALRAIGAREGLSNATVIRGASNSTNLPAGCCDAILMRNVFHYVTEPAAMIRSLAASLKPGGRLAIVDFPPRPNTTPPAGVPANRGGQGIPPQVVESEVGVLLKHVTTVPNWAPEGVPDWLPKEIAPPFVAIFEKAK